MCVKCLVYFYCRCCQFIIHFNIVDKRTKKRIRFFSLSLQFLCFALHECVVALNGQNVNKGQMWPARISPMNRKRFFLSHFLNGFVGQNGYCYNFFFRTFFLVLNAVVVVNFGRNETPCFIKTKQCSLLYKYINILYSGAITL